MAPEFAQRASELARTLELDAPEMGEKLAEGFKREAASFIRRTAAQAFRNTLRGLPALPPPVDPAPGESPSDVVRRRLEAIAPAMLEHRIHTAMTGTRAERREAQQELLDRGGFTRRPEERTGAALPPIIVNIAANPYLVDGGSVSGSVGASALPSQQTVVEALPSEIQTPDQNEDTHEPD